MLVDARCEEEQLGAVEGSVVVDPASHLRIEILGETGQVRARATFEVPGPNLQAFRLLRLDAHGGLEAHEVAPSATSETTPEGITEEVEAGVLRLPSAVRVLAVHDLRLVGVQLEAQGPEPVRDGGPQRSGPFLRVAVGNDVVCVAL